MKTLAKYFCIFLLLIIASAIGSYIGLIGFTYTPQIFAMALGEDR